VILWNNRLRKRQKDKHIQSLTSSDDSSISLVGRYENVKDIETMVPPCIKDYISQQQWNDQVCPLRLNDMHHRNHCFSFHPLLFPIVSGIVKFIHYITHNSIWSSYLNEKVVNNANISEIQIIEDRYSKNVGEKVISKLCLILIVEDIFCFIMYYCFSKYMVKKNHSAFTKRFINANEVFKNEGIPLVWVLDWNPPKYTLYGFSEQCYIELHLVEEENIIIMK